MFCGIDWSLLASAVCGDDYCSFGCSGGYVTSWFLMWPLQFGGDGGRGSNALVVDSRVFGQMVGP